MQPKPFSTTKSNDQLINKWLLERQALIVSFNQLCELRPFSLTADTTPIVEALQEFCQLMVDYISLGHFEVYEHIVCAVEHCEQPRVRVPQRLLQSLMDSTVCSLDFNEKYQTNRNFDHLDTDLSKLAEKVAQRLEWEDELLEAYHLVKKWSFQQAKTA